MKLDILTLKYQDPPDLSTMCIFWGGLFSTLHLMAQRQLENYEKKPKLIKEQIDLLKSRNLLFENEARAESILKNISYNRLSNYWYPLLAA